MRTAAATENLTYDVFVNEWPQQTNGLLPNGEPKQFSPQASTLIYGSENAVLTDPGMTTDQAPALGDWVAEKSRNVTDIFVTHGGASESGRLVVPRTSWLCGRESPILLKPRSE